MKLLITTRPLNKCILDQLPQHTSMYTKILNTYSRTYSDSLMESYYYLILYSTWSIQGSCRGLLDKP